MRYRDKYTHIHIVLHIELECMLTTSFELLEWEMYLDILISLNFLKFHCYSFHSKRERLHVLDFQHAIAFNFVTNNDLITRLI